MITIDGSQGEGGGQILRTSLALSLVTGSFRTTKPSLHTNTNAEVIQRFLPVPIKVEQERELGWRVTVGEICPS